MLIEPGVHILFKIWIYVTYKQIQNTLIFIHSTENSNKQLRVWHRNLWKSSEALSHSFSIENKEGKERNNKIAEEEHMINTHTQTSRVDEIIAYLFFSPHCSLFLQMRNAWFKVYTHIFVALLLPIILVRALECELCCSLGEQKSGDHFMKHYLSLPGDEGPETWNQRPWVQAPVTLFHYITSGTSLCLQSYFPLW